MITTINDVQLHRALHEALARYVDREIGALDRENEVVDTQVKLSSAREKELAKRILSLPQDALMAVLGKHYFGFSACQINRLFGVEKPDGVCLFYTKMLSGFMDIPTGSIIDDASMEHACRIAMRHYFSNLERAYSPRHYGGRLILQWVAAVILILFTAFVTRFSVDAAFRERVVSWVVERFDKYSELRLTDESKTDVSTEALWSDAYVPARFARVEANEAEDVSLYSYATDDGEHMTVIITVADAVFQMDTENIVVRELQINGTQVLLICGDDVNQAVFYHNGHQFDIIGTITSDEMEKITRKILK